MGTLENDENLGLFEKFVKNSSITNRVIEEFQFRLDHCELNARVYDGGNGSKLGVTCNNVKYLVKFPKKIDDSEKFKSALVYGNSSFSEDISCRIAKALNFDVQQTFLLRYKDRICVVCKDFISDNECLQKFESLKNTIFYRDDSKKLKCDLNEILTVMKDQESFDISESVLVSSFWDMFVLDAFLVNFDRHTKNWGFLINESSKEHKLAPLFDFSSCLYPQVDENLMKKIMSSEEETDMRIFKFPNSALQIGRKKINMFEFLSTTDNQDCLTSLKKLADRIDLNQIQHIIHETEYATETQKEFLSFMLSKRKEKILDYALENNPNISAKAYLQKTLNDFEKTEVNSNSRFQMHSLR